MASVCTTHSGSRLTATAADPIGGASIVDDSRRTALAEPPEARERAMAASDEIPAHEALRIYELLVTTRELDERLRQLYRQGRYEGTYYSAVGQEATTVVPASMLRKEDFIGPHHREIGAAVGKGLPLVDVVAQVYARVNSPDMGKVHPCHYSSREYNMITAASNVGMQSVTACGAALAFTIREQDLVAVTWFGEGGTAKGDVHEALNFAAVWRLPLVVVVENNYWAESVPLELSMPIRNVADRARAYNIPGIEVDGNDVLAMYRAAKEAIERARSGDGPTLIAANTYRWYGHSAIDPADYRRRDELIRWLERDPIPRFESHLRSRGLLDDAAVQEIRRRVAAEIDRAVQECEAAPRPQGVETLRHLYTDRRLAQMALYPTPVPDYDPEPWGRWEQAKAIKPRRTVWSRIHDQTFARVAPATGGGRTGPDVPPDAKPEPMTAATLRGEK